MKTKISFILAVSITQYTYSTNTEDQHYILETTCLKCNMSGDAG